MLIGGMDVSGDEVIGNYKYLAIIIGSRENIQSLSDKISQQRTRMSKLNKQSRKSIIKKLEFDKRNRIAFCIALDRTKIIDEIKKLRSIKESRKPTGKIIRTFNYIVMRKIQSQLESYARQNSIPLSEINFECDSDCIPFANILQVKTRSESKAHNIADKVAWCNNKKIRLPSVIELDFTNEIVPTMKKMLNM